MYIPTYYFGNIPIEAWEYPVYALFLIILWAVAQAIRKRNIARSPEYKYFQWGLWAKVFGGFFFSCIYIFYYRGGDTIGYYASAYAYVNLFFHDIGGFWQAYFGPAVQETLSVFSSKTGEPMGYMFHNDQARVVMKLLVPFMIVTGKSYFLATALISVFTYHSIWKLYRTFVSYFPQFRRNLAIGVLFMPSVAFWGSGILKDSFTLAASCYFLVAVNNIITHRGRWWMQWAWLLFASWLIIIIKPYIFLILLPGALIWYFYSRIQRIRNTLVRYLIVPFTYLFIILGSYLILSALGGSMGKFSISKALETAVITQKDLKQEYYEGNSFDIGAFEPTLAGAASKFPAATVAGLYRPFLWESRNAVMLLSGLENFLVLLLTIVVLFSLKWSLLRKLIGEYPIILCSFVFSILFAFMIGITTSNFGALVRFKIPLMPMYMASIMVLFGHLRGVKLVGRRKKLLIG